ncbi:MAG: DEAD/DEAH box helicase [Anaeromyxobacter sp.]|nr:DEAD/DEAH box helicase [Anaeromyxobacter sp.]MBL0276726.1 DEAD/DEAH box helicase [Anaeromyxobacter sp.]
MRPEDPVTTFADLKLSEQSLRALERAGFEHPTPIQARAIPPALEGKDVIGAAATGTGKTAAFLLPIIERLAGKAGTRALVLAPTRELALQIGAELERFGHGRHVRGAVVIGGVGMGQQTMAFRDRREVIIATPGRLVDHLQQGTAKLDQVEILVLDEADRMLDMGFKPQLTRILARLPKKRQTLLFSATIGGEVGEFARVNLHAPVEVSVARSGTTAARAEQRVFLCSQEEKPALLLALLARDDLSTLVFTRTKRRADRVAKGVERAGHKVARIHADRSQGQRRQALDGFKDGSYRVLIATDIAARGIDVEEIGHVVNFDLPHVPEDYVHRVGRTARAEASGLASAFCAPEEGDLLRAIEALTRAPLPRAEVPRDDETFVAEWARAAEGRVHQGVPPHRRPGAAGPSRRPSAARQRGGGHSHGHNRGVHAAAEPRGEGAAPAGRSGAGAAPARKPVTLGTWKPPRKR